MKSLPSTVRQGPQVRRMCAILSETIRDSVCKDAYFSYSLYSVLHKVSAVNPVMPVVADLIRLHADREHPNLRQWIEGRTTTAIYSGE